MEVKLDNKHVGLELILADLLICASVPRDAQIGARTPQQVTTLLVAILAGYLLIDMNRVLRDYHAWQEDEKIHLPDHLKTWLEGK